MAPQHRVSIKNGEPGPPFRGRIPVPRNATPRGSVQPAIPGCPSGRGFVMRVLLVGPDREENLSVRYLSASLMASGFKAELARFNDPDDEPAVVEAAAGCDIVGLSMCFQARAREFLSLAQRLRRADPGVLLVAGGHFASCAAEELLRHNPAIDLVAIHEGERTIVEIAAWRARGSGPLSAIRGIAYREGAQVAFSPSRPIVENLDSLPTPDRRGPVHLLAGVPAAYLFGSRGCLGSCDYCCISTLHALAPGRRFRQRDPERIAEEMADLYHGRGARLFMFHDDNFLVPSEALNHQRLDAFERAFRRQGLDGIALFMKCRPGDATRDILARLQDMGLVRLFIGVEASTARGYASLGRRQAVEESERALRACSELGISAQYTMLAFHPDATLGTIRSDIRFMREHVDQPLNFGRVELHAGTPLERRMIDAGLARGDYLARGYSLVDPAADLACALWKLVSRERCTGEDGLLNNAIMLDFLSAVMRRFYPRARVQRLADDIEAWRLRVSGSSLEVLERIVDWVEAAPDPRDARLPGFLRELATEEDATARALLREGEELHQKLDALTLGMVGLKQRDGRLRRSPGRRRSVARHVAAVAIAFQVAGTVAAFSGCEMEERVLDVDQDGLADDLEAQIFGTSPKLADSNGDGIADASEEYDRKGVTNLEEQSMIEDLARATSAHDMKALQGLLGKGVTLDATYPEWTMPALALAAERGYPDAVKALLDAGADVNAAGYRSGATALTEAARRGSVEIVRALLEAGAAIDRKGSSGYTALMLAAWYGKADVVRVLLDAGADIAPVNSAGKSAMMIAEDQQFKDIARMIKEAEETRQHCPVHGWAGSGSRPRWNPTNRFHGQSAN